MHWRKKSSCSEIRMSDVFAGTGGDMVGYHANGYKTVLAIEINKDAVCKLKLNFKGVIIHNGCIKDFIKEYDKQN